jgi:hypothetical protein
LKQDVPNLLQRLMWAMTNTNAQLVDRQYLRCVNS